MLNTNTLKAFNEELLNTYETELVVGAFKGHKRFLNEHVVVKLIALLEQGRNAVWKNRIEMHTIGRRDR